MTETFLNGKITLHCGDMLAVLPTLAENSIDSVVCDPPYHLTSIVKRFGADKAAPAKVGKTGAYARASAGFMNKKWDGGDIAFQVATWLQVWRVMKPGAHLIAFSGTRTYHRMACAIEDAGFEIRDQIQWLYGSGFPKSRNIGDGRGTALKPAHEPIVLARKPLIGTVAANAEKHGTGALNIDACRVGDFVNETPPGTDRYNLANFEQGYRPSAYPANGREGEASAERRYTDKGGTNFAMKPGKRRTTARPQGKDIRGGNWGGGGEDKRSDLITGGSPLGRWPANVIHDGSEEVLEQFPFSASGTGAIKRETGSDADGNRGAAFGKESRPAGTPMICHGDEGSAARFFYCSKADSDDRLRSKHPTVKPLDLIQYLVRLVTPPRGTVLDCFAGTGTTGEAAWREGFCAVLIEREAEYQADIRRRMMLALSGPDERARESIKAKLNGKPQDHGPLFGGAV